MKVVSKLVAIVFCSALCLLWNSCSNGSDSAPIAVSSPSGGGITTTPTETGTDNGGGTQTPTPTPTPTPTQTPTPTTYTITFNANDGSENPATATQAFTAGTPQALKTIAALGFSKAGFNFAGWGTSSSATAASFSDGSSYTATANATLYALWSAIPVYSVNIPANEHGKVSASPATAVAGTEITLTNVPNASYEFVSYIVTATDGSEITVANGKFKMPEKNVTVTAVFKAVVYTITLNANDGSETPATATQSFTAGTPQALKTISELGFSKTGFIFAGWGTANDAAQSSYSDGSAYTATAAATLYALWSAVPVYSVNINVDECGTVTATPATATEGTEMTLSATPNAGYKFEAYKVTAADGSAVTVTNGKFMMPAQNINVTATFSAISYTITFGSFQNGSVTASTTAATVGTTVTFTVKPDSGYELASLTVKDSGGVIVSTNGSGNVKTFTMPAANVTVTTTLKAINYTVSCRTLQNGSVVASPDIATVGTTVTLTAIPDSGYELETLTVRNSFGGSVLTRGSGNTRTFLMPAANVIVTAATFSAISYTITRGPFQNGSVSASPALATVGTTVTLTVAPDSGYELMSLTVKDSGGIAVALTGTGNIRSFMMPAKTVTVNAIFTVISAGGYKVLGAGTGGSMGTNGTYVTFGLWPQTIKAESVEVNESVTETHGAFTYCKGSDGEWYFKQKEKGFKPNDTYSDGTTVGWRSGKLKWFKVEPIKWRVITTNYGGNKLLLAENGLIAKRYDASKNNYKDSEIRTWLNSTFLQSAFSNMQQAVILTTSVDNSVRTTLPDDYNSFGEFDKKVWNNGVNQYACDDTSDKIFLLSEQEITKSAYGFAAYDKYVGDSSGTTSSTRRRQTTDFAKASGAAAFDGYCSGWLRTPYYDNETIMRDVNGSGCVYSGDSYVDSDTISVVPALCLPN